MDFGGSNVSDLLYGNFRSWGWGWVRSVCFFVDWCLAGSALPGGGSGLGAAGGDAVQEARWCGRDGVSPSVP